MQVAKSERQLETGDLPECLVLWRCIGCGAMGNSAFCTGSCAYRKVEIISADEYAQLFGIFETAREQAERLNALVREIGALDEMQSDFESAYRSLQAQARKIFHSADNNEETPPNALNTEVEPAIVWQCLTCGLVEAPQPCLGVCIRRSGEFLNADRHVELEARLVAVQCQTSKLRVLIRQFASVTPHVGQWQKASRFFEERAIKLLHSASPD